MVQGLSDFFFSFEAGIECRVGFKIHQRNFHCDGLARLTVDCLEDGAHAASVNRFPDLEAVVQYLPDFDFDATHGRWSFRLGFIKG